MLEGILSFSTIIYFQNMNVAFKESFLVNVTFKLPYNSKSSNIFLSVHKTDWIQTQFNSNYSAKNHRLEFGS